MFSLGQITHLNPEMDNINDVQLSWYPLDARNLILTKNYQWSGQALGSGRPSIEILGRVREAFLSSSSPRRFLVRATYGHGKTHLALALANYFGGAANDVEVRNILDQLGQISPAKAQGFEAFKEARAPFLVVRLSGEGVSNLPQAVVVALELALSEHEASRDYNLGFWFEGALEGLGKLDESQVARANQFLAGRQTDLPTLRQGLEGRDGELWETTCALIQHLTGFAPNFGRQVELETLIPRIAHDLCGEGKPFSGVLILFDEFSAFMRSYARDYRLKSGTPLQSLLNGVVNCGDRAAFVGFSQYDLDADVDKIFTQIGADKDDRAQIDKELGRLPFPERFLLHSSLEVVLSNFLRQDEANFAALTEDDDVLDQIVEATDTVMTLFGDHYTSDLGWGDERVQTVLSQGCFPFHPLTIALLCKSNLRGDESGARTLLQYLTGTFRDRENAPALSGDKLNWIAPISLVEGFGRAIVEDNNLWEQYGQALRSAGGEAPEAQKAVLRAMLLHYIADLKVTRKAGSYERNIAVLSGQGVETATTALRELHTAGYLKRDDTRNVYAFWPLGEDGSKVETPLRQEVTATLNNPNKLRLALEDAISRNGWDDQEVANAPGHPQDWAAERWILPRALFSVERLQKLIKTQGIASGTLQDAPRAYAISLIATTGDDLAYFKTNAQSVLDKALEEFTSPPPVVLCLPNHVQGNFVHMLVRESVLLGWDTAQIRTVGQKPFEDVLASTQKEITQNHDDFVTESYIVPSLYRMAVAAKTTSATLMSLSNVLKICTDQAYHLAPPFFTQDRSSNANLKKATRTACEFFLKGTFAGWDTDTGVQNAGKTQSLGERFLFEGASGGWGIVDASRRICEPTSGKVRKGWDFLESSLPRGTEDVLVKTIVLPLLNAPYGYDANTASLLFCAWVGFHQKELEFKASFGSSTGNPVSLRECFSGDPKKFLEEVMCFKNLRITRRDPGENKKQIEADIEKIRVKAPFSRDEAKIAINRLEDFARDTSNETRLIEAAQSTAEQLGGDLKLAEDYPTKLGAIEAKIAGVNSVGSALGALAEAKRALPLGCVSPARTRTTTELSDEAYARAGQFADLYCAKNSSLNDIRDTSKNRGALEQAQKAFADQGLTELRDRVATALITLNEREEQLQLEATDAPFLASLKTLKSEKGLASLREALISLANYQSSSPKTEAAISDAQTAIQLTIDAYLAWYSPLADRLGVLTSSSEFNRFDNEIARYLYRFEGTSEAVVLAAMQRRLEALGKTWDKLADLGREKHKNNDDLKKSGRAFDKLLEASGLSEAQKAHIEGVRAGVDSRFVAAVEAAEVELASYERRHEEGEDPVALRNLLERASEREMAYLADEHKPRLRALHKALQKRIDDDEIKSVEANFLRIQDVAKRRECLRILQKHLGGASNTPVENPVVVLPVSSESNGTAEGGDAFSFDADLDAQLNGVETTANGTNGLEGLL